jgi:heme a synthase
MPVRITPARYRTITAVALGLLITIVITGAAVRLTGSGLGCDDWPNCNATEFVDVSSTHAAIEQVNRLFTGLVAVIVIAAVLGSLWRVPRRRDLTWLSLGLVAGVLGQIVLGGITVLVDLHPVAVQSHMLLSQALVAVAVVLLRRAGEPDTERHLAVSTTTDRLVWALAVVTGLAIVAGTVVTGAGPHAGSEDVQRFGVDITSAARVHGTTVLAAVALAVVIAMRLQRRAPERRVLQGPLSSWIVVALLQAAIGYIQYFNGVPEALVALHVAGATALWAMTVWLVLSTSTCEPVATAAPASSTRRRASTLRP